MRIKEGLNCIRPVRSFRTDLHSNHSYIFGCFSKAAEWVTNVICISFIVFSSVWTLRAQHCGWTNILQWLFSKTNVSLSCLKLILNLSWVRRKNSVWKCETSQLRLQPWAGDAWFVVGKESLLLNISEKFLDQWAENYLCGERNNEFTSFGHTDLEFFLFLLFVKNKILEKCLKMKV